MNQCSDKADVLDIHVDIDNNKFVCKLYDKRASFKFKCNVFPSASSNISSNCLYNTFYSQIFRYLKIISTIDEVINSCQDLALLLVAKGYCPFRLSRTGEKAVRKNKYNPMFAHKFNSTDFNRLFIFFNGIRFKYCR